MLNTDPLPSWEEFTTTLEDYILFIQKSVHVDSPAPPPTYKQDSPQNPKFIQSLYRRNRRRAVRKIIGENTVQCPLNSKDLLDHFFKASPPEYDLSIYDDWTQADSPVDLEAFTASEIWSRLSNAENTAPGLDRITFQHWRSIDPDALTLANIFNLCLKYEKIPDSWKLSKTVYIPKRENSNKLSDWRPISLCTTISKLFTGCLTKRIINWASGNKVLCPAQKGFLPFDGAFKNNYVFDQFQQSCRRSSKKEMCLASIDIANAFETVPHEAVIRALS